jgi:PBP1b-binding outer membrane lipoprotein LpoB
MKRIVTLTLVALLAAACVNTNKKPKAEPNGPAGEPAVEAPVQETAPSQVLTPVKEDKPSKEEPKAEPKPEEVDVNSLTVDALCNQYGVYDLLDQYKQHIQNKEKKAAKEVQGQLNALKKQIKNDQSLPQNLRDSFKTYIEDKEEEIEERFK